jgi:hypothetical protein
MLARLQKYFSGIPPMFIDGTLYFLIAVFQFLQNAFGAEEAATIMSATFLFWTKMAIGATAAGLLAIKLFRSTAYADHVENKDNPIDAVKASIP